MSGVRDYFTIEREPDGLAVLVVENPREDQPNTISRAFVEGLEEVLPALESDRAIRGLVVISGKKDWLVGADLKEIESIESEAQVVELHARIRKAFDRCAALTYPTCAAISGNAPGGGLEWALLWRYRVIASDPPAKLSQAEVKLGLIPGAGGTQRLPRRIGILEALPMILTGKTIYPKKAMQIGLADDMAPEAVLRRAALDLVRQDLKGEPMRLVFPGVAAALAATGPGRKLLEKRAAADIRKTTKGLMPAPAWALKATLEGLPLPLSEALSVEARYFFPTVLDPVSRALRHLFHITNALKKRSSLEGEPGQPRDVDHLGVVGGGFMGTGIAQVALDAGCRAYVRETELPAIARCVGATQKYFADKAKKGVLKRHEVALHTGRLVAGDGYHGLKHAPLVIEAVFEDLEVKRRVLAEVEEETGGRAIFASNTSSLSIGQIGAKAKYPTQVIGMHFFSPVPKMPLLEVIVPQLASAQTVATSVAFGRRLGKHVILVRDKVGFYTTRVIGAFLNEICHLLHEGASVEAIDRAVTALGFPVGPVQLMDEVGLDIGRHVNSILHEAYGDRLAAPAGWDMVFTPGRLGRKSGRGFYLYQDGKRVGVDPSVYATMPRGGERREMPVETIQDRALYTFISEAIRCREEDVLPSPVEGDAGAVFGIGFPPHLGGPFYFVDRRGAGTICEKLEDLKRQHGPRFEPPQLLRRLAAGNEKFYPRPPWSA